MTAKNLDLSIVIPVFNEEDNVTRLYSQLKNVLSSLLLKSEIVFVDDGSKDDTAKLISRIIATDKKASLVRLRAHFGKSDALSAGFNKAAGKIIITLDGDLQDDPAEIPRFIEKIKQGYDLVSGWKYRRKDPLSKVIPSKIFNNLVRILTGIKIHDSNCGFKAYKKEVTQNIKVYGEMHRYIPLLAHRNGFKVGEIKVQHHPRKYGKSKYGFSRMLKGFLDLITITYLTKYVARPLHFFGTAGILLSSLGFLAGIYLTYLWHLQITIWNRPLLLLTVLLIVVGIQFFFTGLLAEMLANNQREDIETKIKKY